jgi:hypothetical protein
MDDIHMYEKRGRHDIEAESANNEEQFTSQFFNFLRKHPELVISRHCNASDSASSEQCMLRSR